MWSTGIKHHQSINRVALRKLSDLTNVPAYLNTHALDRFEGENGPDNMRAKKHGHHSPYQYIDPFDDEDAQLIKDAQSHYLGLVTNLKINDEEKAAFEASWFAHLLVDGLTPAHHFPYHQELQAIGSTGTSSIKRGMMLTAKANTAHETIVSNWKIWGAKGIVTTHAMFEAGVAAISAPLSYSKLKLTKHDTKEIKELGWEEYFIRNAREIATLRMYDRFFDEGWTTKLAREIRDELMPKIIRVITLSWYLALSEAGMTSRPKSNK